MKRWQMLMQANAGTRVYAAMPTWEGRVPHCAEAACPHYDGKRCELLGQRPGALCEPVVEEMGGMLEALETGVVARANAGKGGGNG